MPTAVRKSQSAMEFLMTYGWSILIIAVVIGAFYGLGVFNSSNFAPRAQPGNCKVLRVASTSNLEGVCSGELPQTVAMFNGGSSSVSGPTLPISTSAFTLNFWMNPKAPSGSNSGMVWFGSSSGGASSTNDICIGYTSLQKLYLNGECSGSITTSNTVPQNTWVMVTFVNLGSGSGKLYVNASNPQGGYGCRSLLPNCRVTTHMS